MPDKPILSTELVQRRLRIQDDNVVLLQAILEAHDGLVSLYGDGTGFVVVTTPQDRENELDELLDELEEEIGFDRIE